MKMVEYSSDDEVRDLEVYLVDNEGEKRTVAHMNVHEIQYNNDLIDTLHSELSLLKNGEDLVITRIEVDEDGVE